MWRHVGTLGHEAHVTQVTVIDHVPVDTLVDAVELESCTAVDRVKQGREGIAKAEAAAAAVTDVEDALQLLVERSLVRELRVTPIEWVTRGSLEAPFACTGFGCAHWEARSDGIECLLEAIRM